MKKRHLFITEFDKNRLENLLFLAQENASHARGDLADLTQELERAKVVPAKKIPANVVTMNSKVLLQDVDSQGELTYSLVFPDDADISQGAISVLAPVGTAILGYAKGDIVEWQVPSGIRKLCIRDILYQPEAAGDYHL